MQWGYKVERGYPPFPLKLDIKSHCHALITGSSGSGKSQAVLYLVTALLHESRDVVVYWVDFKGSDSSFLKGYPHYYSGEDCYDGIMKYYKVFTKARIHGGKIPRHLLVCDEFPALVNYISTRDKLDKTKKSGDILSAIAEILMLGRGISNGFGVWIVTQRADASLFANGARDNFMIILGLGRMSKEQKSMIFSGEDIPDRIYKPGEGCLLADGHPLYEVAFPKITDIVAWKRHIIKLLKRNMARW